MKILSIFLILCLILSTPLFSQDRNPQIIIKKGEEVLTVKDIAAFLKELVSWCKDKPKGPDGSYSIGFTIASNQKSQLVTYTVGILEYKLVGGKGVFSGEGVRYFSDRLWAFPGNDILIPTNPFNPKGTEKVKVSMDATTGQITITDSKNHSVVIHPTYAKDILYGFGGSAMFAISFNKLFLKNF